MADGQREADAADEAAELAALRDRVERGAARLMPLMQAAIRDSRINPVSLETAELRIRLEVLSDAAFGDGSRDQYGYELAVQAKYEQMLQQYRAKADELREQRDAEQRRAALLDGVNGFRPPPGGRP
jgi:hypothetical protein